MKTSFSEYVRSTLKNMILDPPLFYNNEIGIRFELGVPYRDPDHPSYFETVHQRAKALFDAVFPDTDEVFLVMKTYQPMPPFEVIIPGVNVFLNYVDT